MVANNGDRFIVEYSRSNGTHDLELEKGIKRVNRRKRNSITIWLQYLIFEGHVHSNYVREPSVECNRLIDAIVAVH